MLSQDPLPLTTRLWLAMGLCLLLVAADGVRRAPQPGPPPARPMLEQIDVRFAGREAGCDMCAFALAMPIKQLEGVDHVRIPLDSARIQLRLAPGAELSDGLLIAAVGELGYRVTDVTRTYNVEAPEIGPYRAADLDSVLGRDTSGGGGGRLDASGTIQP